MKNHHALPFADENCLPQTLAMANTFRAQIEPLLDRATASWPFSDRVLFFAVPDFREEAEAFHEQGGPDLPTMFAHEQLSRFDEVMTKLLVQTLATQPRPDQ